MLMHTIKCVKCDDMGFIRCYAPKAMWQAIEVVKGMRDKINGMCFVDVPCTCDEGDVAMKRTHEILKKHYKNNMTKLPIRADDERAVHVSKVAYVNHEQVLIAWARGYCQQSDERMAAREAPYEVFSQWNSGDSQDEF